MEHCFVVRKPFIENKHHIRPEQNTQVCIKLWSCVDIMDDILLEKFLNLIYFYHKISKKYENYASLPLSLSIHHPLSYSRINLILKFAYSMQTHTDRRYKWLCFKIHKLNVLNSCSPSKVIIDKNLEQFLSSNFIFWQKKTCVYFCRSQCVTSIPGYHFNFSFF